MFGIIKTKEEFFAFLKACVIYGSEHMNRFGEEKGCRLFQKGLKQVNAFHLKHFSFLHLTLQTLTNITRGFATRDKIETYL